jgi:PKD repeat protein
VSFSGGASGGTGIYTFDWGFGDGSSHSAEQNPSHVYAVGGGYVATVRVTDSAGASASASVAISVTHNCWVACGASVPLATRAGQATSFSGSAIPADCSGSVSYSWEFGDGQSSTQQNPSHGYASAGLYAWSFTATAGAASCSRSGTIVVTSAPANFSYLIAALAHKPGFYESQWRADLTVLNPNDGAANLTLVYFSESAPVLRNAALAGHTSVEWSDIVVSLFGFPQDASTSGVVQVISDVPVASTGRSYNLTAGGTFGGTFPALTTADGVPSGKIGLLPQLKRNASYRSNVGFANPGTITSTIRLRLFDQGGVKLGEKTMDVAAGRWTQLDDVFGTLGVGDSNLAYGTVEVLTEGGLVWAYAAVIDNATGDPTVVPVIVP